MSDSFVNNLRKSAIKNVNMLDSTKDMFDISTAHHKEKLLNIAKLEQNKFLVNDIGDHHFYKKQTFHTGHIGMVIIIILSLKFLYL